MLEKNNNIEIIDISNNDYNNMQNQQLLGNEGSGKKTFLEFQLKDIY